MPQHKRRQPVENQCHNYRTVLNDVFKKSKLPASSFDLPNK